MSTYKTTSGKSKVIKAKKGKTYYYKVRAYTYDSKGNKVYGPWSTTKAYKIEGTVASAVKSKNTTKTVYITKTGIRYHLNTNEKIDGRFDSRISHLHKLGISLKNFHGSELKLSTVQFCVNTNHCPEKHFIKIIKIILFICFLQSINILWFLLNFYINRT